MTHITRRLYDLAWKTAEKACRVTGPLPIDRHYALARERAGAVLEDKVSPTTAELAAAQIACQLTAAAIGDYLEAVTVIDDAGALAGLQLPADATADQISARYRFLIKQLGAHPGDQGARELLQRVTDAYRRLEAIGRI
jgi:hypothetical protein